MLRVTQPAPPLGARVRVTRQAESYRWSRVRFRRSVRDSSGLEGSGFRAEFPDVGEERDGA